MSAHPKLTPQQKDYVREITTRRREAFAKLAAEFPTNEELAKELNCSRRAIERASSVGATDVSLNRRLVRRSHSDADIDRLAAELTRK